MAGSRQENSIVIDLDFAAALGKVGVDAVKLPDVATFELDRREYLFLLQQLTRTTWGDREQAKKIFAVMIAALQNTK